jgi:hypothetical protein
MKYICLNPKCENYQIEDEYLKEVYSFTNGKLIGKNCRCPRCGQNRKEIDPNVDVPLSEKNIEINKFDGLSVQQKQEVLKKRSHEHFKKNIKERKDGLLNKAMSEMRNIKSGK